VVGVKESVYQHYPYDPNKVRMLLDKFEEEKRAVAEMDDEPDENAALYDHDFETAEDNHLMVFRMLDAYSSSNVVD